MMCDVLCGNWKATLGTRGKPPQQLSLRELLEILLLIECRCLRFLFVKGFFYGSATFLGPQNRTQGRCVL